MGVDPAADGVVAAGEVPGVVGVQALDADPGAADAAARARARASPAGGRRRARRRSGRGRRPARRRRPRPRPGRRRRRSRAGRPSVRSGSPTSHQRVGIGVPSSSSGALRITSGDPSPWRTTTSKPACGSAGRAARRVATGGRGRRTARRGCRRGRAAPPATPRSVPARRRPPARSRMPSMSSTTKATCWSGCGRALALGEVHLRAVADVEPGPGRPVSGRGGEGEAEHVDVEGGHLAGRPGGTGRLTWSRRGSPRPDQGRRRGAGRRAATGRRGHRAPGPLASPPGASRTAAVGGSAGGSAGVSASAIGARYRGGHETGQGPITGVGRGGR